MSNGCVKCDVLWGVKVFMSWRGPSWQTRTPNTCRCSYCSLQGTTKASHYWKMKTAQIEIWKLGKLFQCGCLAWRQTVKKICRAFFLMHQTAFYQVWLVSIKTIRVFFCALVTTLEVEKMLHNFFILQFEEFVCSDSSACVWLKVAVLVVSEPGRRVSITVFLFLQFGCVFQDSFSATRVKKGWITKVK